MTDLARTALRTVGGLVGAGVAGVAYAALVERTWFTLRRYRRAGAARRAARPCASCRCPTCTSRPGRRAKIEWVRSLAELDPDFVVNSGDNLAHVDAVPPLLRAMEPLLERPGAFVLGSNDYFAPVLKNPARYLTRRHAERAVHARPTSRWADLVEGLRAGGWADLNNARDRGRDGRPRRRAASASTTRTSATTATTGWSAPAAPDAALTSGLVHAPYQRVLDAMVADGASVVLAGHTHGGQLARAGLGRPGDQLRPRHPPRQGGLALVARRRSHGRRVRAVVAGPADAAWLHVSAGLGTSPYAPVRFACRPEATLLTLVAARRLTAARAGLLGGPGSVRAGPISAGRGGSAILGCRRAPRARRHSHGVWRSLVARFVRDEEAAGSNPVTPTVEWAPDLQRCRTGAFFLVDSCNVRATRSAPLCCRRRLRQRRDSCEARRPRPLGRSRASYLRRSQA